MKCAVASWDFNRISILCKHIHAQIHFQFKLWQLEKIFREKRLIFIHGVFILPWNIMNFSWSLDRNFNGTLMLLKSNIMVTLFYFNYTLKLKLCFNGTLILLMSLRKCTQLCSPQSPDLQMRAVKKLKHSQTTLLR